MDRDIEKALISNEGGLIRRRTTYELRKRLHSFVKNLLSEKDTFANLFPELKNFTTENVIVRLNETSDPAEESLSTGIIISVDPTQQVSNPLLTNHYNESNSAFVTQLILSRTVTFSTIGDTPDSSIALNDFLFTMISAYIKILQKHLCVREITPLGITGPDRLGESENAFYVCKSIFSLQYDYPIVTNIEGHVLKNLKLATTPEIS